MIRNAAFLMLLLVMACMGQAKVLPYGLPDWVQRELYLFDLNQAPKGAPVWRLYDEWQLGFDTETQEVITTRRILQVCVSSYGSEDAGLFAVGGSEDGFKLVALHGWLQKTSGQLFTLSEDQIYTAGRSSGQYISSEVVHVGRFPVVRPGDFVVFEVSYRQKTLLGAQSLVRAMSSIPVRRFAVVPDPELEKKQWSLSLFPQGFGPWNLKVAKDGGGLRVEGLPANQEENMKAENLNFYPFVIARFAGPGLQGADRYRSWDTFAGWYHQAFQKAALDGPAKGGGQPDLAKLQALAAPFHEQFTYRQVYLSQSRGWLPLQGGEVMRRRYGDCKDMVSCLTFEANAQGISVLPVLTNIGDGAFIDGNDTPAPIFNHLIAAIPLQSSLGLASEVEVAGRRFFIFDPTDADARFGFLHPGFEGRSLLICAQDQGLWVKVPSSALEPSSLRFSIEGKLDEALHLKGQLTIEEKGNANDFRSLAKSGNTVEFGRRLRQILDLPPLARLSSVSLQTGSNGDVVAQVGLDWPGFLRIDADGYRLADAIFQQFSQPITKAGERRGTPFRLYQGPPVDWRIRVEGPQALRPGKLEEKADGSCFAFHWSAKPVAGLDVTYGYRYKSGFYDRRQLQQGVDAWQETKGQMDRFRQLVTIFYP